MSSTVIAADLAKNVFEIAVSHRPGQIAERHRLSRRKFLAFFAERKPATVIMESCASSHHWGRQLQALGHSVRLLPPRQVRPYVLGNKTDRSDAKGLRNRGRPAAPYGGRIAPGLGHGRLFGVARASEGPAAGCRGGRSCPSLQEAHSDFVIHSQQFYTIHAVRHNPPMRRRCGANFGRGADGLMVAPWGAEEVQPKA